MKLTTAYIVANYIADNITDGDFITIEWFGGEPLINKEVMALITSHVKSKIKKHNELFDSTIKFHSSIITNGSLIDEATVQLFKKCDVKTCQITLDGYGSTYDEIKNYVDKNNKFDKVIDNIELLLKNNIKVNVRLNYTNDNYDSLITLINFLHERFNQYKNFTVYVYPVWNGYDDNNMSTAGDKKYLLLIKLLVNFNLMSIERVPGLKRKVRQCIARNINSVTILPDGSFVKCAESFKEVFGNVEKGITDTDRYNDWVDTSLSKECIDCKYLPLCNDGCKSSKFTGMDKCFPTKNIFDDIIKWYVEYLDSHKERRV